MLAQRSLRTDARGYRDGLRFAERHARGVRVWAIEGAGHYGAGFRRFLGQHGEAVIEVSRIVRAERRLRGKDDLLDAVRAARSSLAIETPTLPQAGQRPEALRVLLLARRSAVDVRQLALVQLRSVNPTEYLHPARYDSRRLPRRFRGLVLSLLRHNGVPLEPTWRRTGKRAVQQLVRRERSCRSPNGGNPSEG